MCSDKPVTDKVVLALPKGRILKELQPVLRAAGIVPEDAFFDKASRKLRFETSDPGLDIIRVRAFDVATMVAYGGADLGVVGSDVLEEFNYDNVYTPLDLDIGHCRLSVAAPEGVTLSELETYTHIRVATKYPTVTERYFAARGIQAECIKLNGAMEIAPALGMATHIVDLVSTGSTLLANDLRELETLVEVSSRLIVNRHALKTRQAALHALIAGFQRALAQ